MKLFGDIKEHFSEALISDILRKGGLEEEKRLEGGNSGAEVIVCKSPSGKKVVKIPKDKRSLNEVLSNIKAYREMELLGLRENLPKELYVERYKGVPYIVMSYLDLDFATETRYAYQSDFGSFAINFGTKYQKLCNSLEKIYKKTVRRGNQGVSFLSMMEQNIIKKFEKYLIPAGLSNNEYVKKIKDIKIAEKTPSYTCFAPYDFTPEDIFLIDGTIIYPDPKQELRGVPQIALACFAGVARDAYRLPGSNKGYKIIERFASEVVPDIIHISKEHAEYLFTFGRALQCAISSRFRIDTEPNRAVYFADESMKFIDMLYSLDFNKKR